MKKLLILLLIISFTIACTLKVNIGMGNRINTEIGKAEDIGQGNVMEVESEIGTIKKSKGKGTGLLDSIFK